MAWTLTAIWQQFEDRKLILNSEMLVWEPSDSRLYSLLPSDYISSRRFMENDSGQDWWCWSSILWFPPHISELAGWLVAWSVRSRERNVTPDSTTVICSHLLPASLPIKTWWPGKEWPANLRSSNFQLPLERFWEQRCLDNFLSLKQIYKLKSIKTRIKRTGWPEAIWAINLQFIYIWYFVPENV